MRIENIHKVSQIYAGKNNVKSTDKTKQSDMDQLQISQTGRDYQLAKQAVSQVNDVREDLVLDLKARMDSGTYEVSGDEFAAKVIDKYNQLML